MTAVPPLASNHVQPFAVATEQIALNSTSSAPWVRGRRHLPPPRRSACSFRSVKILILIFTRLTCHTACEKYT